MVDEAESACSFAIDRHGSYGSDVCAYVVSSTAPPCLSPEAEKESSYPKLMVVVV